MSGSVLGMGLLGAVCVVACGLAPLAIAVAGHQRLQGAADSAALAAADAASGRVSADPCALAAEVADALEAALSGCEVDAGGDARVRLVAQVGGFSVAASARAGPPPPG